MVSEFPGDLHEMQWGQHVRIQTTTPPAGCCCSCGAQWVKHTAIRALRLASGKPHVAIPRAGLTQREGTLAWNLKKELKFPQAPWVSASHSFPWQKTMVPDNPQCNTATLEMAPGINCNFL
ncbi:hypothetical protein KIL84_011434 [Mauremys mutica]|uniref:Uncharacterized protein n=1 Tax=Mauremys mutica TaxID=74926 RepID=A0A9D4AVC2_9SAUR|nr:hypothetical protein KIL84_011434 [Mauremys mutica]